MTDNPPSEDRSVRGNDINPATIGGRKPVESVRTNDSTDTTINIPSDFATFPEAMRAAMEIRGRKDKRVIVNIESGFSPESGFSATSSEGLLNIWIRSDDTTVTVDSSFSGDFVYTQHADAPVLDTKIDMAGNGNMGYQIVNGAVFVTPGSGVVNAGYRGIQASASVVWAERSVWSGAAKDCFRATVSTIATAQGADLSDAGRDAAFCSRGAILNVKDSDGTPSDLSNASRNAVRCRRGRVNAANADMSGAGLNGIDAQEMAIVNAPDASLNSLNGDFGITARNSLVNAKNIFLSSAGNLNSGVRAEEGATVNVTGAAVTIDDDLAIESASGSHIVAVGANLTGNGTSNVVFIKDGSTVSADSALVDDGSGGNKEITAAETNVSSVNDVSGAGIIFV